MDDRKDTGDKGRDEASILTEIGRRIREGIDARGGEEGGDRLESVLSGEDADVPAAVERDARTAHEIRTPLSAIATAAEAMRDERLGPLGSERYREYASGILDNARHALAVVDRMMTDRRAAPRRSQPAAVAARIDLNAIAAGVVETLAPLALRQGIALEGAFAPTPLLLAIDATRLRQILMNAVTNALKFTPRGGCIRIVTGVTALGSAFVDLSDTGPGMTRAEVARSMSGGGAGDEPGEREGRGLGLGIPTMQRLACEIGARLSIESVVGRGTTVALDFPGALVTH
jgi:signal transduction histidine kinase